jgi:Domain of unknown function DUF29
LGRSQARAIESRLKVLLVHLLKWQTQPHRRSSGWRGTIAEQRSGIHATLQRNPSLRPRLSYLVDRVYRRARTVAATGLPLHMFPATCLFTLAQIIDPDFVPE